MSHGQTAEARTWRLDRIERAKWAVGNGQFVKTLSHLSAIEQPVLPAESRMEPASTRDRSPEQLDRGVARARSLYCERRGFSPHPRGPNTPISAR